MINKIKMLYDIYFSRINVDRQLQLWPVPYGLYPIL